MNALWVWEEKQQPVLQTRPGWAPQNSMTAWGYIFDSDWYPFFWVCQ